MKSINSTSFQMQTSRKWGVLIFAMAAVLGLAMGDTNAFGQSGAGSIQGTVTDSTGAAIAGASIHVLNDATTVAADTKSNDAGFYQVPGLFTGAYTLTISAPGMKTYQQIINLLVAQHAVINPTMTPGAITQEVQVSGDTVQLTTTDSGEVASTLENARINQLPMNGRNLLGLVAETTPGLDPCGAGTAVCANGMLYAATDLELDGVTLQSREFGGTNQGQYSMPDPDSIQEVRTETNGESAEYAMPSTVVMTTKSGTNQLHGAMFETARNNAWGIAKLRQNPSNFAAPHYVRNEFGASAGGPIVLPHIYDGKGKSFWFFGYERFSLASGSYQELAVPTMAMRSGDWSGLVNSSGVLQQLYDPATTAPSSNCNGTGVANQWCRAPFPTSVSGAPNQIPIGRLSPTAQVIYAITPQPTTTANPLSQANLSDPIPNNTTVAHISLRLDHEFNENNRAYLRYTSTGTTYEVARNYPTNEVITVPATVNGVKYPAAASGEASSPDSLFSAAIGFTHIFSPTFFSDTVLSQQWFGEKNLAGGSPLTDFESELGVPNNFGESGFPFFSSAIAPLEGTQYEYGLSQIISNIDENLTKTAGKHQMQFGGRFRHERFGFLENQNSDTISFGAYATALESPGSGANYTAASNTGYADADEFLGAASSYNVNLVPYYVHFHDMEFDGYFQDDYHVARSLTLNLGARYEAHPAPWVKNGLVEGLDVKNHALVLGNTQANLIAGGYTTQAALTNIMNDGGKIETAQEAGLPSSLLDNYNFSLLPRVGFAWQPFGKWGTVLRGAYGRYIYSAPIYSSYVIPSKGVPFELSYSESYTLASQSPDGLPNYLLRSAQSSAASPALGVPPIVGVNSANAVNSSSTNAILPGMSIALLSPDYAPDYVTQANVTIEQPMKGKSVFRLTWSFAHDANAAQTNGINNPPSNYVWEMQTGTIPPNGGAFTIGTNQYAATATGPYDKVTWGQINLVQKTAWSTDNALHANFQSLFHHGVAYQIGYEWSKPMDLAAAPTADHAYYPYADYATSAVSTMTSPYGTVNTANPGPALPSGLAPWQYFKAMNRFENYRVDTNLIKQNIRFNGIVDIPFGRGKRFFGKVNRFGDELVGGWQLAGDGDIRSQDFLVSSSHWGATNPLHVYKHKTPITDCRSGVCYKEHEWFNGYVAPTANASTGLCTTGKCVSGLPSDWAPYQTPIDNTPGTKYYGADEVSITLPGGSPADIAYSPSPNGANPFSKTVLNGPMNWTADASLFKVFPINERMNLRFTMDAFNVFNVQGVNNPNATDGTTCETAGGVGCSSFNQARQLQFTLRLTY